MTPNLQIPALLEAYRAARETPTSVARAVLAAIDRYPDPAVWIARADAARVLRRAADLEADPLGARLPLYGIPFAVKDNIDAAGYATTAACPAFAYTPADDAAAVQRLLDAGAMLFGKTNLDQFATGLVGTRSPFGAPHCVFDALVISGGSSSGSAVAVAAGLVSFALGTDTAGSGRVPASFNNIVGLKPTKGLVSTRGVVPACRSLDCVSIFAATADEARTVLDVLRGPDGDDPFSRDEAARPLPGRAFRFGVLAEHDREFHGDHEAAAIYDDAIGRLRALGGAPVVIDYAPFREVAGMLYGGAFVAERLAAIGAFHAAHADQMDAQVRSIIDGAAGFSAADAFVAQYRLQALAGLAARQWRHIDVLLLPTTPTIFTTEAIRGDPLGCNSRLGLYTNFVNLLDYAAIAVPAGFRGNGLPAGVTLVGPAFCDDDLAALGGRLHAGARVGSGLARAPAWSDPEAAGDIPLAVAGAHMSGMSLNAELVALGACFEGPVQTAACYRLMLLAGTSPAKPALLRDERFVGPGVAIELWRLTAEAFGRFVAAVPQPMSIGKVLLADGSLVPGFLCEPAALAGAREITDHGGWRAYLAAAAQG
ncbi:allophanate hydrolase [Lichenicoccus sp.]|uniref:allophanate hydrolase n=1 Tax=Lichenicoccus sp. TaxID=2781899 RepID=UPI003D09F540